MENKKKSIRKPPTRRRKRMKTASMGRKRKILILAVMAVLLFCTFTIVCLGIFGRKNMTRISPQVESFRPEVEKYAAEAGIPDYVDYLLAIMQVESGGSGKDVMQSSESLGLAPNTLDTDESIRQGCAYLAETLGRAEALGCDTLTAVQAYNYGIDYVDFVAENGGAESIEIAEEFAKQRSGGATVNYYNGVAIKYNGGYRYRYGNMFYAELVRRLVEGKA